MFTPHGKGSIGLSALVPATAPSDQQIGGPAVASPTYGKGRIAELEKELHQCQHILGLHLIEKKEWAAKYVQCSQAYAQNEAILKREQAAHLNAISEYKKREERIREALYAEKQRVADLEKALREIRSEIAEVKFVSQKKIGGDNSLQANIDEDKRPCYETEWKAQENQLKEKEESLNDWQKRLVDFQISLSCREEKLNASDRILKMKQEELHELHAHEMDIMSKYETLAKKVNKEQEVELKKNELNKKMDLVQNKIGSAVELIGSKIQKIIFEKRELQKIKCWGLFRSSPSKKAEHSLEQKEKHNEQKDYVAASAGHKRTFTSLSGATTTEQCVENTEAHSDGDPSGEPRRKRQQLGEAEMQVPGENRCNLGHNRAGTVPTSSSTISVEAEGSKRKTEASCGDDANGDFTCGVTAAKIATELGEGKVDESSHMLQLTEAEETHTPVEDTSKNGSDAVNVEATETDCVPSTPSDSDLEAEDDDEDGEESPTMGKKMWRFLIT